MPRKKKPIDEQKVLEAAKSNLSLEEMCAVFDIGMTTLLRRFSSTIKRGRKLRNASLKRKQYELAMQGDRAMLIWLGKQELDQKEPMRVLHEGTVNQNVAVDHTHKIQIDIADKIRTLEEILKSDPAYLPNTKQLTGTNH